MAEETTTPQGSPALNGKFRVVGTTPGVCYTRKREKVDLTTISLADAQRLVTDGFQFLEPITPDAAAAGAPAEPEAEAKTEPEPVAPARPRARSRKTPAA